jgi:hypothetical protein
MIPQAARRLAAASQQQSPLLQASPTSAPTRQTSLSAQSPSMQAPPLSCCLHHPLPGAGQSLVSLPRALAGPALVGPSVTGPSRSLFCPTTPVSAPPLEAPARSAYLRVHLVREAGISFSLRGSRRLLPCLCPSPSRSASAPWSLPVWASHIFKYILHK